MYVLAIGDIVGVPGRRVLASHLPQLREHLSPDLIIANAENAHDSGVGITPAVAEELFALGVDVLTNGNHVWDQKEAIALIERESRMLRPHNDAAGTPGTGWLVLGAGDAEVGILNLIGNMHMGMERPSPFAVADEVLRRKPKGLQTVLVDFHAQAPLEKSALAWYLDGRVSAVFGTHTHVPTADERVLPGGTAYITDIGMTGCYDSVVGLQTAQQLKRLVEKVPAGFDPAEGAATLCAVWIDIDSQTGKSRSIRRFALDEMNADNVREVLTKAVA